jgi:photoactive yellow protein
MRIVKFGATNVANELAQMSDEDIDNLAFGLVELDRDGKILRYNAAEADIAGLDQEGMVGRDFFKEVAPCTRTDVFEGRFRQGVEQGKLDIEFAYVFDHQMPQTQVRVHMKQADNGETYWVMVKRVGVPVSR